MTCWDVLGIKKTTDIDHIKMTKKYISCSFISKERRVELNRAYSECINEARLHIRYVNDLIYNIEEYESD